MQRFSKVLEKNKQHLNYYKINQLMKTKTLITVVIFCCIYQLMNAQIYIDNKSQHRFAQTYVGLNTQITPSTGQLFYENESSAFPTTVIPRVTIGGLHFWGRLDFKMSFALARFGDFELDENTNLLFRPGGDFSGRFYPWQIQYNKVRPFVGVALNQMTLGLEREAGNRYDFHISTSVVTGLSYGNKDWQINAEVMLLPFNKRNFYINRNEQQTFELPQSYFSIGLVRYFDTTLPDEQRLKSGETVRIESTLKNRLNSFSLGIAPSAAYFLASPSYNTMDRISVPRHKINFNWDIGIGYLFDKSDIHVGLSYRDYTSTVESYNLEHLLRRTSIAAEGFKFLFDYHGFVPFVGPSISYDRWAYGEFEGNTQIGNVQRTRFVSPGIIFGWDITPSPIDTWTLRTNLRYYPMQKVTNLDGESTRVDQFEFNFIQLVIYPNRMVNVRKAKRKK